MSTYTQLLYQIVFSTWTRERTLSKKYRDELFKYITGLLQKKNCHLYIINGVEDHLHILTHIHPNLALSSLVKDIKLATSNWIKTEKVFKHFNGWQEGYGAFTYSLKEKDRLINYLKNQEEHHYKKSFEEEYRELLKEHGIEFNEKYLF